MSVGYVYNLVLFLYILIYASVTTLYSLFKFVHHPCLTLCFTLYLCPPSLSCILVSLLLTLHSFPLSSLTFSCYIFTTFRPSFILFHPLTTLYILRLSSLFRCRLSPSFSHPSINLYCSPSFLVLTLCPSYLPLTSL